MSMGDDLDWRDGPGIAVCYSACIGCGRVFGYDPERVPSCRYVHRVHNSLELALERLAGLHAANDEDRHEGGRNECPTCTAVQELLTREAVAEPICPSCCRAANPERARRGFDLLPTEDTADAVRFDEDGNVLLHKATAAAGSGL